MSLAQSIETRHGTARGVAAYALAFLLAAPCCFVGEALAAPAVEAAHAACHDQGAPADDASCGHVMSPATVGTIGTPIGVLSSYYPSPAAAPFAPAHTARTVLAAPHRPPPLAAGPVPLFLLHLRLLN